jgi:hypothetical protein
MNSQWDAWVIGYNMDRQRQFFSQLGFPAIDWQTLGIWLMAAALLITAGVTAGMMIRERPKRLEASLLAWNRFCAKLAAAGLARAPEGPLDYLARAQGAPAGGEEAERLRGAVEARYGAGASRVGRKRSHGWSPTSALHMADLRRVDRLAFAAHLKCSFTWSVSVCPISAIFCPLRTSRRSSTRSLSLCA